MNKFFLLLHTLRYLKLRQIAYRLIYRLKKIQVRDSGAIISPKKYKKPVGMSFHKPATMDGNLFTFLGRTEKVGSCWNNPDYSKLWLYNLHYQDDLNSLGCEQRTALCSKMVDRWIANNPPIEGSGWEPYCISLRLVNWVKFFSRIKPSEVKTEWIRSLGTQAEALIQQLEYHILGNHLFANAKGLIFSGASLGGKQGKKLLNKGLKILDSELDEQFLEDGAHFERSPMYQGILLWDLLDLISLSHALPLDELKSREKNWALKFTLGVKWLLEVTHPDGKISFFNDTTFGIAPELPELYQYAHSLGISLHVDSQGSEEFEGRLLGDSCYGIVTWRQGHKLIADVGDIGPAYQPGHSHAETLSCELSIFDERVLVNSGINQYGTGPGREKQRSSAAHNCLVVNQKNSSEVWSGFRVARRAKSFNVKLLNGKNEVKLTGCHDGYKRIGDKVIHCREWIAKRDSIEIIDTLNKLPNQATAYWHFHPKVLVKKVGLNKFSVRLNSGKELALELTNCQAELRQSHWYPSFGFEVTNTMLEVNLNERKLHTRLFWS